MTKDQINGLIRSLLVIAGTFLVGHNLLGNVVNPELWQEITGAIMVVVSFVWTVRSKELTVEILQSTLLKIVSVIGTLLISSGKLSDSTLQTISGLITILAPILYSILSKKKSADVASGKIATSQLSK